MVTTIARGWVRTAALVLVAALAVTALGCGAAATTNYYATAITQQERCCDGLADAAAREECRTQIRRVDSETAANTDVNQQTYECVDRHFQCDSATGRATRESAQAQFDCLNDLGAR
jgi:hypothetical protein